MVKYLNHSGDFQEVESNYCGQFSHVPSQPAGIPSPRSMLSCDKHLPPVTWNLSGSQENVIANPRSTSQLPYRGIHQFATPSARGEVPVHKCTGALVAREEERIGKHNSNADTCKQAVDHELLYACGYPTEFYGWTAKTADFGTSI